MYRVRRQYAILNARRASLNWQGSGLEIHRGASHMGVRISRPPPFFAPLRIRVTVSEVENSTSSEVRALKMSSAWFGGSSLILLASTAEH